MKKRELEFIAVEIKEHGLDHAFVENQHFCEANDQKFQYLRIKYLECRNELLDYLCLEYLQVPIRKH